jgi:tartrate dehydratase alpha subunit/fumarate hydratase class I-like protein
MIKYGATQDQQAKTAQKEPSKYGENLKKAVTEPITKKEQKPCTPKP